MATSANGLERQSALQDVYYAHGAHGHLVSLGKLEGQGWDVRLCEGGMEPRIWDGDPFTNVAKENVIPLRAALAACATCGTDACVTRPTVVALTESGAIGMAITVFMRALHASQPKRYTSHIRKGTVAQANTWVEFTLTSPTQVKSTGGKEHEYIAVDDYTRAVYTQPLRVKSEAPEP